MTILREIYITDPVTGKRASVETNGALAVNIQDQHTPILMVPMNREENTTTLTSATAIDDTVIAVTSATGFAAGKFVAIGNIAENRYYVGEVVSVASLNVTLDTPLDFAFPTSGTVVAQGTHDLAVDGSVTPVIFSLRATDPGLPVEIDVTRILIQCITSSAVDLNKFGNIAGAAGAGLTNGVVLRAVNGTVNNIFNAKNNGDLAGLMYDWSPYTASNPSHGVDGFIGRLTFSGQSKIGVTIRLAKGDDLEFIVQDDLTSLTTFKIIVEGHVVTD